MYVNRCLIFKNFYYIRRTRAILLFMFNLSSGSTLLSPVHLALPGDRVLGVQDYRLGWSMVGGVQGPVQVTGCWSTGYRIQVKLDRRDIQVISLRVTMLYN